jgi:hypothetical protein
MASMLKFMTLKKVKNTFLWVSTLDANTAYTLKIIKPKLSRDTLSLK